MRNAILAAAAVIAAAAVPAAAADYKTGPYAGLTVGYSTSQIGADGLDIGQEGANVAGLAGFTFRAAGLVWGAEGDLGWNGVSSSFTDGNTTLKASGRLTGTARGRAGVALGPALLYGTAGVAFRETSIEVNGTTGSDWLVGYVAGGGVEIQMTNTVQVRLEALRYGFPDSKISVDNIGTARFDQTDTVVRAGLTFALN
mgnify:CR=1 FL=1